VVSVSIIKNIFSSSNKTAYCENMIGCSKKFLNTGWSSNLQIKTNSIRLFKVKHTILYTVNICYKVQQFYTDDMDNLIILKNVLFNCVSRPVAVALWQNTRPIMPRSTVQGPLPLIVPVEKKLKKWSNKQIIFWQKQNFCQKKERKNVKFMAAAVFPVSCNIKSSFISFIICKETYWPMTRDKLIEWERPNWGLTKRYNFQKETLLRS
jgi:hypothetical protein